MPLLVRAGVLAIAVGVVATVAGGCGSRRAAVGFCAEAERGHAAFDWPLDERRAPRALAQFDRVIATAPPGVAADLKIVSETVALLYRDPLKLADDPALVKRYRASLDHVDQYLRQTCGFHIPVTKKKVKS